MTLEAPSPVRFDEPHGDPGSASHSNTTCITCGDVARPLSVVAIDRDRGLALCEAADGGRETVEIALVDPVEVGDELLVHAATAIAKL